MPQIDLEMDALAMLRLEARKDGDDLSACVRRLISDVHRKKPGKRVTVDQLKIPDHLTPQALAASYPKAILRFMFLLGWLSKKHGADFAMVQHYTGRGRIYFARNQQIILDAGNSTKPQRIPESDFWVCTNLSNQVKGQIIDGVMAILGYPPQERRTWVGAIEREDLAEDDFDLGNPDEDFDDHDDLKI